MKFILCLWLFAAVATADVVSITLSGVASGSYDCAFQGSAGCETLIGTPFILTLYGPSESFNYGNGILQLPPPITGGSLTFGNVNQSLLQSLPGSNNYNQNAFTVLPDPQGGSFSLYQGNPLYAILVATSPNLVSYGYNSSLFSSDVSVVHPPGGIQGDFLTLASGYVQFDSFSNVDVSVTVNSPGDPVPEPGGAGLVAGGIVILAYARSLRRRPT